MYGRIIYLIEFEFELYIYIYIHSRFGWEGGGSVGFEGDILTSWTSTHMFH